MPESTNYINTGNEGVNRTFRRCREKDAEIERLRASLLRCSDLACGMHHAAPSDRCAAIAIHVDTVVNGEAKKTGVEHE